uniref:PH domain-containing protein n=1 Tax=Echinostoma caproni TaxID=27848 RepID=A0A183ABQ9_9TREM
LPPKGTHRTRVGGDLGSINQDYEEPRSMLARDPDFVSQRRPHPLTRLSLSPQLEIVESQRCTGSATRQPISNDNSMSHADSRDDIDLTLPKRCLTTQARRFSAFMDPPWTLAGALHHRYKPNKWTRLNLCLLIGGSRLIGYRTGHALTPNLVLFLCGSSGIYAGRDSGMDHVIKIAHSTRGMAVLAADTEEQALVWIRFPASSWSLREDPLFDIALEFFLFCRTKIDRPG